MILRLISTYFRPHSAMLALICVLLLPSFASGADRCGSLDRIIVALRLTRALYPELKGKELSTSFSLGYPSGGPTSFPTDARTLGIKFDKPEWHPPKKNGTSGETKEFTRVQNAFPGLPIFLDFDFIDDAVDRDTVCRPVKFMNSTEGKRMEEARKVINAHPEWSDAQMLKAARQYGLRYGPEKKAAILQLVLSKKLDIFYGPLRIKKIQFEIYGNLTKCKSCTFADLRWYIDAEEVGTPRMLNIVVESFGGKIVSLAEWRNRR